MSMFKSFEIPLFCNKNERIYFIFTWFVLILMEFTIDLFVGNLGKLIKHEENNELQCQYITGYIKVKIVLYIKTYLKILVIIFYQSYVSLLVESPVP